MTTRRSNFIQLKPSNRKAANDTATPWKVLSVEDNTVYQRTQISILKDITFMDRPLDILTASSAAEACEVLSQHNDIAVVLLDIVMETDHAGLQLVDTIREIQGNDLIRIVIVTGQPGVTPASNILERYDIDHYYEKSQLSSDILRNVVKSNLKAWNTLDQLKRAKDGLQLIVDATRKIYQHSDVNGFSNSVLDEISKIAGIEKHNIRCYETLSNGEFTLNSHHDSVNDSIHLVKKPHLEADIRSRLRSALRTQDHVFCDGYSILYFGDNKKNITDYFVYIDAKVSVSEYSTYLLKVFSENAKSGFINVTLTDQLKRQAFYDPDLDIYNRRRFTRELLNLPSQQWRHSRIVVIHVDGAESVASVLGRDIFTIYLDSIFNRAKRLFNHQNLYCRMSHDSLAFLIDQSQFPLAKLADFKNQLENANKEFSDFHFNLKLLEVPLGNFTKNTLDEAFSYIDLSRYDSTYGNAPVQAFDLQRFNFIKEQFILTQDLYKDVEREKIDVYFQPIIDLKTEQTSGCEALARWMHDDKMISPETFIGLAVKAGFINKLDTKIIEQVVRRSTEISHINRDLIFSINLSPTEVAGNNAHIDNLLTFINENALDPTCFQIEITEEEPVRNYEFFDKHLKKFKESGLKVAVDDFGKGYSSLMHIVKLNIDTIKIDRHFVNDFLVNESSALAIELTRNLAERLNLKVVAEGVETLEQVKALIALGIGYAQGYYFSKPMPWPQFVQWLKP